MILLRTSTTEKRNQQTTWKVEIEFDINFLVLVYAEIDGGAKGGHDGDIKTRWQSL